MMSLLPRLALILCSVPLMSLAQVPMPTPADDPNMWLEGVTDEKAIDWVKAQDAKSKAEIEGRPEFAPLHERLLAIYNSRERIPGVQKRGKWLYNFWQDASNPRGLWRRTTLEEYRKKDPAWEVLLDFDAMSAKDNVLWVWKGATCLFPDYDRCLVSLSRGGADADEVREYDTVKKEWVADGFFLPESKGSASWRDRDTIYIARDFGPGTLTTSGYPRVVKEWKRGTPLKDAKLVFEGQTTDVGASAFTIHEKGRSYDHLHRSITFWEHEDFLRAGDKWVLVQTPRDADIATVNDWLLVKLKTAWKPADVEYKAGSLVGMNLDRFMAGHRELEVLFEPSERVALADYTVTRTMIVLDLLDNVKSRVVELRRKDGKWVPTEVNVPPASTIGTGAVDRDENDDYWMTVTNFIEPTSLYLATPGTGPTTREKLKSLPAFFDAKGLDVTQGEATSKDGTRIPYFVVMREGTKLDGNNPTILYGYGGFEIPMLPSYSGTIGAAWLERGGIWVLANIRGGGEFGPKWHEAAITHNRQKAHDDFIAVAEDVERRGISSPKHLGIMGGSQGGLLVGATFTQRPELFKAVVCQVPLLDMRRFHKLLAGASWMGEYGNPDDADDWQYIEKYSPYQNVVKDKKYPRVFFYTSTRDDRVHPGHARKMVAKMEAQGHDVLYYEYLEGGHSAGSTPAQQAYMWALTYTFLINELR
ncbi:MAG TPA: prolyl oligopeptidase family serine peptidase [Usitatibacter sp.]|nr:prolyl oligopeptidase family serine peptidase [Usitatibacter sp.]